MATLRKKGRRQQSKRRVQALRRAEAHRRQQLAREALDPESENYRPQTPLRALRIEDIRPPRRSKYNPIHGVAEAARRLFQRRRVGMAS